MSIFSPLTGEVSDSKVAAIFRDATGARNAAARLTGDLHLTPGRVRVVTPGDAHLGRQLEPESHGIFRTMLIAHYKMAFAGLVVGILAYGLLRGAGIAAVVNSPVLSAVVIVAFFGVFGAMLGGLVTLRPDHSPYVNAVKSALRDGRSAVIVHAMDTDQRDRASDALTNAGGETIKTL
ncbi:hypothetical protein [Pseudoxanthomonas mexicana]|uniref:hypothetical protein n=1 Tax=Pseudoxanthomonas mexicana TaxID=128785 RepID=UPI0007842782|nr:hypothetical protein [Pseudoxanthomonas mexicana]